MFKKIAALLLALVMIVPLAACQQASEPAGTPDAAATPAITPGKMRCRARRGLHRGTYSAAAPGLNGDVNVSVTFSADAITAIEVLDNIETPVSAPGPSS